jgi:hypothetical protein
VRVQLLADPLGGHHRHHDQRHVRQRARAVAATESEDLVHQLPELELRDVLGAEAPEHAVEILLERRPVELSLVCVVATDEERFHGDAS